MDGELRKHWPRWWYPTLTALFALALTALLSTWWTTSTTLWVTTPLVAGGAVMYGMRLTTSPDGVLISGRRASWDELERHPSRLGAALRTPPGTPWRDRVSVALPLYYRDWANSPLGEDLARWAPELLEETDGRHESGGTSEHRPTA